MMGMYDCIGREPEPYSKPDPPTPNQIHDRKVHGYGEDKILYIRDNDEYLGDNPELCRTSVQQSVRRSIAVRARKMANGILDYIPDSDERTFAIGHIREAMAALQGALDKDGCCDYCWLERG